MSTHVSPAQVFSVIKMKIVVVSYLFGVFGRILVL